MPYQHIEPIKGLIFYNMATSVTKEINIISKEYADQLQFMVIEDTISIFKLKNQRESDSEFIYSISKEDLFDLVSFINNEILNK